MYMFYLHILAKRSARLVSAASNFRRSDIIFSRFESKFRKTLWDNVNHRKTKRAFSTSSGKLATSDLTNSRCVWPFHSAAFWTQMNEKNLYMIKKNIHAWEASNHAVGKRYKGVIYRFNTLCSCFTLCHRDDVRFKNSVLKYKPPLIVIKSALSFYNYIPE